MMWLSNLSADIALAIGLSIAAVGVILLSQIGILPKKSLPYVILAIGAVFGVAWFKKRQADGLRRKLEEKEKALKQMEGRLASARERYGASEARLAEARSSLDATRAAVAESVMELDASHEERLREIANLQGEELDAEITALLARLTEDS